MEIVLTKKLLDDWSLEENTDKLDFSDANIVSVKKDTFLGMNFLVDLDLSDNKISFFPSVNIPTLKRLVLNSNKISYLDGDTIKFENLKTLYLSKNNIRNIIGNFSGIKNLSFLDISYNKLNENSFRENSLAALTNLRTLVVSRNKFGVLGKQFANLPSLKKLYLNNNNIKKLDKNNFEGLINLNTLYLSCNKIKNLNRNFFTYLRNLKTLTLSDNFIYSLPENVFSFLKKLEILQLQKNKITLLNERSFRGLSELYYLDISENKFTDIERSYFYGMIKLENLYIFSDDIETDILSSIRIPKMIKLRDFTKSKTKLGSYIEIKKKYFLERDEKLQCQICLENKEKLILYFNRNFGNEEQINRECFFISHQSCYKKFLKSSGTVKHKCINGCEDCEISGFYRF